MCRNDNVVTGKSTGRGLSGDRLKGTGLDLEVDADAFVEEEELVGGRNQDGIVGFEKTNTKNNWILKITNDDARNLEGKAGPKVVLDNGSSFGLHQLFGGREDPGSVALIEQLRATQRISSNNNVVSFGGLLENRIINNIKGRTAIH